MKRRRRIRSRSILRVGVVIGSWLMLIGADDASVLTHAGKTPPAERVQAVTNLSMASPEGVGTPELAKLKIEEERLSLEREKLGLERERLRIEQSKDRWMRVSGSVTAVIPIVVALMTLWYTVWSFRKQNQLQAHTQAESARLEFEIKAAEIAFAGKTPEAVRNRAIALKSMFNTRLPSDFAATFDPKASGGGKETPEAKTMFLELLLKYPSQRQDIMRLWDALFGDDWLERVKPLLAETRPATDARSTAGGAPPPSDPGRKLTS